MLDVSELAGRLILQHPSLAGAPTSYTADIVKGIVAAAVFEASSHECNRWKTALEEFGFTTNPGLSPKENLAEFGDWWSRRKASGN